MVASPAATVSLHPFSRYEILLQEGVPVKVGEILGMVRRQTGRPEYPLMFGADRTRLALNLLGPANRPLTVASAKGSWSTTAHTRLPTFIVERVLKQGDVLVLQVRQVGSRRQIVLPVNLPGLERTLEGER